MARRKGKGSNNKQDDSLVLLEPPVGQSRGINEYILPGTLFLIILVGGSTLCWFSSQQQQAIDELSETLATMQTRVTTLQQQLGTGNAQLANVGGFEERLLALEEAFAKAQRQAEVALAASEQIQSKDLQSKVWALQTEITSKLAELQQNTISITSLNAIIKNKSDEIDAMKQSVRTILNANTDLAISISGLTNTLSVTEARLDEHISIVDGLMSELEGQKREIAEIKESFSSSQEALVTNAQKFMDIQDLLELEHVKKTQADRSLEDHESSTVGVHSHLTDQLEAVQSQFFPRAQQEKVQVEQQEVTTDGKQHTPKEELTQEQGVRVEEEEDPHKQRPREEEMLKVTKKHGVKKGKKITKKQEKDVPEVREAVEEEEIPEQHGAHEEEDATEEQGKRKEEDISEEQGVTAEDELTEEQEAREEEELSEDLESREEEELREKQGVTAADELIEEQGVTKDNKFTDESEARKGEELSEKPETRGEVELTEESEVRKEKELTKHPGVTTDAELTEESRAGPEKNEVCEQHVNEHADSEKSNTTTNQTEEPDLVRTEKDEQIEEAIEDEIQNPDTTTEGTVKEEQIELSVAEKIHATPEEKDMDTHKNEETFAKERIEDNDDESQTFSNGDNKKTETEENGAEEQDEIDDATKETDKNEEGILEKPDEENAQITIKHEQVEELSKETAKE